MELSKEIRFISSFKRDRVIRQKKLSGRGGECAEVIIVFSLGQESSIHLILST